MAARRLARGSWALILRSKCPLDSPASSPALQRESMLQAREGQLVALKQRLERAQDDVRCEVRGKLGALRRLLMHRPSLRLP